MFRRAMKRAVQRHAFRAKGIKAEVGRPSGRRAEMRTEWCSRSCRVPLHTLRADIDWLTPSEAHTTYGVIGAKGDLARSRWLLLNNRKPAAQPKSSSVKRRK